ncbi:MAG: deoxyribodipyrimidine photo-lyase [Bacteroidota bacterium]
MAHAKPYPRTSGLQVVWFKRDLRIRDHRPLYEAAQRGPVLPLYIVEPSVITADDFSGRHWVFIEQSLRELRQRLADLGQPLVVRQGEVVEVLERLRHAKAFTLWAHEETGNGITYARDIAVRQWTQAQGIPFVEIPQNGVVRALKNRDAWAKHWEQRMRMPQAPIPSALTPLPNVDIGVIPTLADLPIAPDPFDAIQLPGEAAALECLDSFLNVRGADYQRAMSSPVTAWTTCSRISPHLTWGTIGMRQVVQATRARRRAVQLLSPEEYAELPGSWQKALSSFASRLHWHCHFMQKLESEPRIEHESFVTAYDGLRQTNPDFLERWALGQTGYPMVDASMRAVAKTGYLNFRMRAMLVSFAAYDLWMDWRDFTHTLSRYWLDYEPGIHLSQVQMQSGTQGINTLRVYSPTKQAQEQDPDGAFIRRWVPELEAVPGGYIHEPWRMPPLVQQEVGCIVGIHYPHPIVDHKTAAKQAKDAVYAVRQLPETRAEAQRVMARHGSRSRRRRYKTTPTSKPAVKASPSLFDAKP